MRNTLNRQLKENEPIRISDRDGMVQRWKLYIECVKLGVITFTVM